MGTRYGELQTSRIVGLQDAVGSHNGGKSAGQNVVPESCTQGGDIGVGA